MIAALLKVLKRLEKVETENFLFHFRRCRQKTRKLESQ